MTLASSIISMIRFIFHMPSPILCFPVFDDRGKIVNLVDFVRLEMLTDKVRSPSPLPVRSHDILNDILNS